MHKFQILLLFCGLLTTVFSCKEQSNGSQKVIENDSVMEVEPNGGSGAGAPSLNEAFATTIANAHNQEAFRSHPAVAFDMNLDFNTEDRLDSRITMLTSGDKIHIDKSDGSSLIYDGKNVFLSPQTATDDQARFNAFTWAYFFALPYKLNDPGVHLEHDGQKDLEGITYQTYKLTFDPGTGDSPDDWYILYINEDNTLHAAAYIVTYGGKDQQEAEENPHCIVYDDYISVQEVPFATQWNFYNWSEDSGIEGEPIGSASLTMLNFTSPKPYFFEEPASAVKID